ncbi:hypothetical protein MAR_021005 [Mya arenaria]|uniref:Uncharacterized protein n=1 Tax=Mya arenaria TaxID=6604 RepID=A0ABY7EEQ1_MYAAR|nr:hypothetical protein MAR_021005 [Mya arenaria]
MRSERTEYDIESGDMFFSIWANTRHAVLRCSAVTRISGGYKQTTLNPLSEGNKCRSLVTSGPGLSAMYKAQRPMRWYAGDTHRNATRYCSVKTESQFVSL